MAASDGYYKPWCAAKKCPVTPNQCFSYINENIQNQTSQNLVACCKIQCGRSANHGLVAVECGGATTATAVGIVSYVLLLLFFGGCIVAVGPFRRFKTATFWIITVGSLIFTTGTGVFVTNVTSPFIVLRSMPALGAMNVSVFSYFYSGFRYGIGLAYEGVPLVVFVTTAIAIGRVLVESTLEDNGAIRTGNNLAVAMLVFIFLWIVHSVSYRLYGYRVDWRLGSMSRPNDNQIQVEDQTQDPRFHLGAAQGHPTWRTPMGQSTSVITTALAWWMVGVVKKDLALQKCRPDWVFNAMLYGAPTLISATILWNILSGIRCRTISGQRVALCHPNIQPNFRSRLREFGMWMHVPENILGHVGLGEYRRDTRNSNYPGLQSYKDFADSFRGVINVRNEYVQAVALHRMERNTLFNEDVPDERLLWSDKAIGNVACLLAQVGLVISSPGFFSLMLVANLLAVFFELIKFRKLVETKVTDSDRISGAKVVEQCYVGADLSPDEPPWKQMFNVLNNEQNHRSINLHTLLDNTGPGELYDVLSQPGLRAQRNRPLQERA